jgi:gluconate 2-dehydrogenase
MTTPSARPSVLVCRAVFPDIVDRLREHFEVETNEADVVWTPEELVTHLQGKAGVFITGTSTLL